MKLLLINFFILSKVFAGTFTTNSGAFFSEDTVRVTVASNTDCTNAGVTKDEIIGMIGPAIDDYWNTVTSSRLKLVNGGEYSTTDNNFNTARLCNADTDGTCPDDSTIIPRVPHIVISCNSNTADNFTTPASTYAMALSNNVGGNNIKGTVILINSTASTPFSSLSYAEQVAVIAHEIGHGIGIGHTVRPENLMYFTPTPVRFALGRDDATAMTYLYPKKIDGCGLLSTKDVDDDFFGSFLLSLLFFLGFGIILKKLFFKFKESIFEDRLSRSS